MNNHDLKTLSLKLAKAILLHKGEISMDELKALPFLAESDAELIANYLLSKFNLKIHSQKFQDEEWVDILSMI